MEGVSELWRVLDLWRFSVDVVLVLLADVWDGAVCGDCSSDSYSTGIGSRMVSLSASSSISSEDEGLFPWLAVPSFDGSELAELFGAEGSGYKHSLLPLRHPMLWLGGSVSFG
jgi:hypothetical protein